MKQFIKRQEKTNAFTTFVIIQNRKISSGAIIGDIIGSEFETEKITNATKMIAVNAVKLY